MLASFSGSQEKRNGGLALCPLIDGALPIIRRSLCGFQLTHYRAALLESFSDDDLL